MATKNLPYDRIYLYDAARPLHLSWAPEHDAMVVQTYEARPGRLMPRSLSKENVVKLGD